MMLKKIAMLLVGVVVGATLATLVGVRGGECGHDEACEGGVDSRAEELVQEQRARGLARGDGEYAVCDWTLRL